MLATQPRTRLEPDTKDAARRVVEFLLDHQTMLEEKRAVLNWYGTSCAAVQALVDTIPAGASRIFEPSGTWVPASCMAAPSPIWSSVGSLMRRRAQEKAAAAK